MNYWTLIEPFWEAVSIYDGAKKFLSDFEKMPTLCQNLFAVYWLQSEVCNGGFSQFYGNSTGVLAPEAVIAFKAIGMPETAKIIEDTMVWFGADYPRERHARKVRNDDMWNNHKHVLRAAEDRFFARISHENGGFENAANDYAERGTSRNTGLQIL